MGAEDTIARTVKNALAHDDGAFATSFQGDGLSSPTASVVPKLAPSVPGDAMATQAVETVDNPILGGSVASSADLASIQIMVRGIAEETISRTLQKLLPLPHTSPQTLSTPNATVTKTAETSHNPMHKRGMESDDRGSVQVMAQSIAMDTMTQTMHRISQSPHIE